MLHNAVLRHPPDDGCSFLPPKVRDPESTGRLKPIMSRLSACAGRVMPDDAHCAITSRRKAYHGGNIAVPVSRVAYKNRRLDGQSRRICRRRIVRARVDRV
jgi:hypothetical protein